MVHKNSRAAWVLLVGAVVCFDAVRATRNVGINFFHDESSAAETHTLSSQPDIASFGVVPYGNVTGKALLAYVQSTSLPLMCSAANIGPPNHAGPWVALALRGECPFAQKTLTAQQLGAQALIIVDNENSRGGREPHMADGTNSGDALTIPTLLISREDGAWLRSKQPQYVSIDFTLSGPQVASPNVTVWNLPTTTKGAALLTHYRPWFTDTTNFKGRVNVQPRFPFLSASAMRCDGKTVTAAGCDSCVASATGTIESGDYCLLYYQNEIAAGATPQGTVREVLLQTCLHHVAQGMWWEYAAQYAQTCFDGDGEFQSLCGAASEQFETIAARVGLTQGDIQAIQDCAAAPASAPLADALPTMARQRWEDEAWIIPHVLVQGWNYDGNWRQCAGTDLASCTLADMICYYFSPATKPPPPTCPSGPVPAPTPATEPPASVDPTGHDVLEEMRLRAVTSAPLQAFLEQEPLAYTPGLDTAGNLAPSRFGVRSFDSTLQGKVFYAGLKGDPLNTSGCAELEDITGAAENITEELPVFVLLDRGSCNFAQKVHYAQQAGAAAVIIADDVTTHPNPGFPSWLSYSDADAALVKDIEIPSMMIRYLDAYAIKSALCDPAGDGGKMSPFPQCAQAFTGNQNGWARNQVVMQLEYGPEAEPPVPPSHGGGMSPGAVAGTVIGVLLVVGLAGVFLWRTRRRRNEGVVRHGKLSLDPSSESHNEFVAAAHYDEL